MTWDDTTLAPLRLRADAPADTALEQLVAARGADESRRFFNELIRNVGLPVSLTPPEVQAFIDAASVPPAGLDLARVARGQQVFIDNCPQIALILYFKSLPMTYLNWRLCRTLAATGRLGQNRDPASFARRVGETTQFVFDVMTPGSLQPGGVGVTTTLKVRLVHASVRHFSRAAPGSNEATAELPICQEDLAYTLHTFGLEMVDGLRQLETPLDESTAEDFFYAWQLVGHYLGIEAGVIPRDLREARAQQRAMLARLEDFSADGAELTRALLDFARRAMLPGRFLDNSAEQLLRFFVGEPRAGLLGVPAGLGWFERPLPLLLRRFFGWAERLEDRGLGLKRLGDALGVELIRGIRQTFVSYKGQTLELPDVVAERLARVRAF